MSKLDLVILEESEIPAEDETGIDVGSELHSVDGNVEKLARAWPELMQRLRSIIERDDDQATAGGFKVDTVEFSIGFEGGFDIGFAAKANASATITFKR